MRALIAKLNLEKAPGTVRSLGLTFAGLLLLFVLLGRLVLGVVPVVLKLVSVPGAAPRKALSGDLGLIWTLTLFLVGLGVLKGWLEHRTLEE